MQRRIVARLVADEEARREGVAVANLRPLLPRDRSNARRAIRTLLKRGDAEIVVDADGLRRLRLPFWVAVREWWKREPPEYEEDHPMDNGTPHGG